MIDPVDGAMTAPEPQPASPAAAADQTQHDAGQAGEHTSGASGDAPSGEDGAGAPRTTPKRRRGSRGGRRRSGANRARPDGAAGDDAIGDDAAGDDGFEDDDGDESHERPSNAGRRGSAGQPEIGQPDLGPTDIGPTAIGQPAIGQPDLGPTDIDPTDIGRRAGASAAIGDPGDVELPDPPGEGKVRSVEVAERALVRRPQIGDSRPARAADPAEGEDEATEVGSRNRRRRGGRGGAGATGERAADVERARSDDAPAGRAQPVRGGGRNSSDRAVGTGDRAGERGPGRGEGARSRGGEGGADQPRAQRVRGDRVKAQPVRAISPTATVGLDAATLDRRRGKERNGRPVGRYLMCVHVRPDLTQIAVLEGRSLIEHYVSRPADDQAQIHGNVYLGRVQNVLPGMEAAFIDIATPKNAVLYRGDVQYEAEDIIESPGKGKDLRIEQLLKPKQLIMCQVTKNPIGAKGARLTQEVSLPGRFVVLIPNSKTYGISKRLPDDERKRLRSILDKVKPAHHGVIVRTAAENVVAEELRADVERLLRQWEQIESLAKKANGPALLYREPDMAVRVIREEFNQNYRGVVIDDRTLFEEVRDYVASINPTLADRVEFYDAEAEGLPAFERHHVHEQLHKALDRKVWLPSGGSLIIEHTEALTVIDVNTGKNVGTTNLEETVFRNNLEAADEIARQLRLRDVGGIIVIDFIDMEIKDNRAKVVGAFRDALSRDKTRTQVFDISELGLVEMTRKRIGEGLLTAFADPCPMCEGRGVRVDHGLLD